MVMMDVAIKIWMILGFEVNWYLCIGNLSKSIILRQRPPLWVMWPSVRKDLLGASAASRIKTNNREPAVIMFLVFTIQTRHRHQLEPTTDSNAHDNHQVVINHCRRPTT
jgi:hypothetical protein